MAFRRRTPWHRDGDGWIHPQTFAEDGVEVFEAGEVFERDVVEVCECFSNLLDQLLQDFRILEEMVCCAAQGRCCGFRASDHEDAGIGVMLASRKATVSFVLLETLAPQIFVLGLPL